MEQTLAAQPQRPVPVQQPSLSLTLRAHAARSHACTRAAARSHACTRAAAGKEGRQRGVATTDSARTSPAPPRRGAADKGERGRPTRERRLQPPARPPARRHKCNRRSPLVVQERTKKHRKEDDMPKKGNKSKKEVDDVPNQQENKLPDHLELQRTRVVCNADAPIHTQGIQYSGAFAAVGVDNSVSVEKFCKNFKIEINRLTEDDMEFDMIGIDASIANAFRRILIAEVPTMAIEKIFMVDNTSVIADEVLSHRLGLIPLHADPRLFDYISENDVPNERNTIVYKLHVSCPKGSQRITVKSSELEWLPEGSQLSMAAPAQSGDKQKTFTSFSQSQKEILEKPLGVKFEDITIARLGPGQAIELEAHAVKGVGKVHAKWSPVATAWYRMLPEVVILKEIEGDDAEELVKKCPVNVFDIEDLGNGRKKAVVAKPRACTLCRECVMGPTGDQIQLRRVRDHFIFTIESTGALPPEVLFTEAVKILEEKCERVISELS